MFNFSSNFYSTWSIFILKRKKNMDFHSFFSITNHKFLHFIHPTIKHHKSKTKIKIILLYPTTANPTTNTTIKTKRNNNNKYKLKILV